MQTSALKKFGSNILMQNHHKNTTPQQHHDCHTALERIFRNGRPSKPPYGRARKKRQKLAEASNITGKKHAIFKAPNSLSLSHIPGSTFSPLQGFNIESERERERQSTLVCHGDGRKQHAAQPYGYYMPNGSLSLSLSLSLGSLFTHHL